MRYFILLLLAALSLPSLHAQNGPPDPGPAPAYQELFVKHKRALENFGKPVGRAGNAAYVRGQYVLNYAGPDARARFDRDYRAIQAKVGQGKVRIVGECGCTDEYSLFVLEFTDLGGEERGQRGRSEVASMIGHEEVEPNYYVIPGIDQLEDHVPFNKLPKGFQVLPSGKSGPEVKIALLDTGLDPYFQDGRKTAGRGALHLWENQESPKQDPFCLDDDIFGWDMVNNDNAPLDDHGHGTHIASRIAEALRQNAPNVNYKFMALKMLDEDGAGTSFTATCATLYAAHHGADLINASWGFYGEEDVILRGAIEYAERRGVAVIASAGNERENLARIKHYPSNYSAGKMAVSSISAARHNASLWPGTNFIAVPGQPAGTAQFLATPGVNVIGYSPSYFKVAGNVTRKTGTSVAVPLATAMAADYLYRNPTAGPTDVKQGLEEAILSAGTYRTIPYGGGTVGYRWFRWITIP